MRACQHPLLCCCRVLQPSCVVWGVIVVCVCGVCECEWVVCVNVVCVSLCVSVVCVSLWCRRVSVMQEIFLTLFAIVEVLLISQLYSSAGLQRHGQWSLLLCVRASQSSTSLCSGRSLCSTSSSSLLSQWRGKSWYDTFPQCNNQGKQIEISLALFPGLC